ncbi:MAG: rod shape-determining protein RodA [Lachnospiraceae bacterium]|nr:rod shape-determining protein RodA [Lachnospiraceae bacterium]
MIKLYRLKDYDFKLVVFVIALSVIGIFAVSSANQNYHNRQVWGVVIGIFLMLVVSFFDYNIILKLYWFIYAANIILLVMVRIQGARSHGAQRWLNIGGVQFQPSETAKIMLIVFFAAFIMKHAEEVKTVRFFIFAVLLFIPIFFLIYSQPDMSTSIVITVLFAVLLFEAGISWKVILGVIAIAIPTFIILFMMILQSDQEIIEDYQQERIFAYLNPEEYSTSGAYQQRNSVMAIGSGQLMGKGYDSDEINSVKNGNFISEPQTDFIFAVIGEEFGFIGTCTVILLLIFISIECIIIAKRSKDLAGLIIASGMGSLIAIQGFINIGVATNIFPNTGLPLPFVSYGLTSLISLYIGIGFVLNVRLTCNIRTREGIS